MPINSTNAGKYLARQLEQYDPTLYAKRYPELHGAEGRDVPITPDLEVGTAEYVTTLINETGIADLITEDTDDFNYVDYGLNENKYPVHMFGIAIRWNERDIERSRRVGFNQTAKKMETARYKIEERMNNIAYFGDERLDDENGGYSGLLNNPFVTVVSETSQDFYDSAATTADQLVELVFDTSNSIFTDTNMVETAKVMLCPSDFYTTLAVRRIGADANMTALQYILKNSPFIKEIRPRKQVEAKYLEQAGVFDAGTDNDRLVFYDVSRTLVERHCEGINRTEPMRIKPMTWCSVLYECTTGVIIHYPKSMRYVNIQANAARAII